MFKRTTLFLLGMILLAFFTSSILEKKKKITIFMIGDSTMADKSLKGGNPERGWGHMLPGFLSEDVVVENHAQNGRSSKSFIDEGRWDSVITKVEAGDYVFIQFGHNDQKTNEKRYTKPGDTYDANLIRFVDETRAKGGTPVLYTSIIRRKFDTAGKLVDTHGEYPDAVRRVAAEKNVLFIDMQRLTHDMIEQMGDEESKKLFMWVLPQTLACCPDGKEDDTHLNIFGGRMLARLVVDQFKEKIPALAPYVRYYDFVVAKDGSGDFFTVQEAINAVPDFRKNERTTILVREGVYKEKLIIPESKINVSLIGEDGAILSYDDYADKKNIFGENKGTSGSASCYIYAPDFYAENITFENTSGPVGQAVACFVSGDRVFFKRCRFLGFQDTLYTYGKRSRQYYEDCYIEGTVDFIFGWSTAVFNHCQIHSKRHGYVTAPSTDEGGPFGYVFYDCRLTADEGVDKVYLSRPWRPYAKAVFIRCDMGKHIIPEGWHNWNKSEAEKTVFYAEYKSTGEGANPDARAPFSHQLTSLDGYDIEKVLMGDDGWNPVKEGNALISVKR